MREIRIEPFKRTKSISRRLTVIIFMISSFFVLETAALYFTTRDFLKGLTELHQGNRISGLNVQTQQLIASERATLGRLATEPVNEEIKTVFASTALKIRELIATQKGLTVVEPEYSARIEIASEALQQVESIAASIFDNRMEPKTGLMIANQFFLESTESLLEAFIRQHEKADRIFDEIYSRRYNALIASAVLGAIFISVALWVGLGAIRSATRSIASLGHAASVVGEGRLSYRAPILENDELGELADGFNRMTSRLESTTVSKDRLEHINRALFNANKELEAFSYSVSHDLRAPLRAIDGFSQAILEDYSDKLDVEGKSHLQRIRTASQRMARLIDDILNLSRIMRSEMKLSKVDLSALAHEIIEDLRASEPERKVEVVVDEDMRTRADPGLIKIMLENLIGNAWKYTSRQPNAKLEIGKELHGGKPAFFVRDNGVGFDMNYSHKLFGAFQRLHSEQDFPGMGVGLATVQRIIARHGGHIEAEGRVGKGATFYFTL